MAAKAQASIPMTPGDSELIKACKEGNVDVVLKQLDDGKCEKECLDVAVEHKRKDVAEEIAKHDNWRKCLKISTKENGTPTFRTLLAKMPDIAPFVLDQCVNLKEDGEGTQFTTDFRILEESDEPAKYASKSLQVLEKMALKTQVEDDEVREGLLLHPVVLSLLRRKWLNYMIIFFFINMGIYVTFLIFLTAFALSVPNPQVQTCKEILGKGSEYNQTNASNGSASTFCGVSSSRRSFLAAAAVITIIYSLVLLLLKLVEVIELVRTIKRQELICKIIDWTYFRTYLEIPLYILSIAFVSVFQHECLCPTRGQWQAGIIAVFVAWIDLIFYLNKWPLIGLYIQMLMRILQNFVKLLIMAILLLFAFNLAFYMAFYEPDLPDTPFDNPGVSFVQMISYTVGSPDISIFRLSNDDTRVDNIPYPGLSYIIWIVFAVIMSVLFLNLLTGLAVEDVQKLRKEAQRNRIIEQIQLFKNTEIWVIALKSLCFCQKNWDLVNGLSKNEDVLEKQEYYWQRFNAFIGDEKEDIIAKASKVTKEKEKWMEERKKRAKERRKREED